MNDYESQYEEYKRSILENRRLRNELHEKYQGSLRVEKDYIDENGVLWKVGVLSGVCGLCLSLFWLLEDRSDTGSIITRIILLSIMIAAFVFAMRIGSKFKKSLGEMIFYAFRYSNHFEEHIQEDKRKEMYEFEQNITKIADYMHWCVDRPSNDHSEVLKQFRHSSCRVEELEKQYKHISRYDSFATNLKNDYWFNAEIQKDIDK